MTSPAGPPRPWSRDFLREPAPREIPSREIWAYSTRNYRHRVTIVWVCGLMLWLASMGILAKRNPSPETLLVVSLVMGVLTLLLAVPTWLDSRARIRQIEHLLRRGEVATGTLQISVQTRKRRPASYLVTVRERSVRGSPNEPSTTHALAKPIVSTFAPVGLELAALRSGDTVDVLLSEDPAVEDLVALVTAEVFCVGWVRFSTNTRARGLPTAWFLIGFVLLLVAPLAVLCTGGAFAVTFLTILQGGRSPFSGNLAMGAFSIALLVLLSGYLLTASWRLAGHLLRRRDAGYWFHPVLGVGLGTALGLLAAAALVHSLANGVRSSWAIAVLPLMLFAFAGLQARVLVSSKKRRGPSTITQSR